ncbi:MAG: leucine-rich repeat protein [Ruminococcus sp.]|nr:leucine-rich repeat protein [Ruminococcus sp.]
MKVKKMIAGIIAVCVMGMACPVVNSVSDVAVIKASAVDDGTYEQLKYRNYGDYIEIYDCVQSATEIVIPSEIDGLPVTDIGEKAFYECWQLKSVNIADSVKNIGAFAFCYCKGLTTVNIPDSVEHIGLDTFGFCSSLKSIKLSDNLTSIGDYAFYGCSNLTSIEIPKSLTKIGSFAFYRTLWLEEKRQENPLVIVNEILIDGENCSGDISIPDGVKTIGYSAFAGNSDLISITIPDSVTSIGKNSFVTCSELKEITFLNPECDIDDDYHTITNKSEYFYGTIYGYENSTAQEYAEKYRRSFVSLGTAPEKETSTGDMNGDNSVNIADAVLLQKCILGSETLTEEQFKSADMNSDGFVDSFDLVLLRRKVIENNK